MARGTMDRIDRSLRTMDLHELARLYCRAHNRERESTERIPRLFYRVIRRHIADAVRGKLADILD